MRQSNLFTKTTRENPKDEASINAQYLMRGGFIHKEMAGVYDYLPLGLRVLRNIEMIIREEINAIGGQELLLSALQDPAPWKTSGRWNDDVIDVWFKLQSAHIAEAGLGNTHEEPLTVLMRNHISSYKDLPVYAYQFQTKFRNEPRAKSGLLRTREFMMKDLYSFSRNTAEHDAFYERVKEAYAHIFDRVGIGGSTYLTYASGGSFSPYSHEFQTVCSAGEDTIYIHDGKRIAVNREICTDETLSHLGIRRSDLREEKAIEVGNIFSLGTRFSEALGLRYRDERGQEQAVVMGSYGIGPGRLMGTVVESSHDEKGVIWPLAVAPFLGHLIEISSNNKDEEQTIREEAEKLYHMFADAGLDVLYDDRADATPGEKFADADLLGMPYRIVVSAKTLAQKSVEIKKRAGGPVEMIPIHECVSYITHSFQKV